jgi:hypothetical protein
MVVELQPDAVTEKATAAVRIPELDGVQGDCCRAHS